MEADVFVIVQAEDERFHCRAAHKPASRHCQHKIINAAAAHELNGIDDLVRRVGFERERCQPTG